AGTQLPGPIGRVEAQPLDEDHQSVEEGGEHGGATQQVSPRVGPATSGQQDQRTESRQRDEQPGVLSGTNGGSYGRQDLGHAGYSVRRSGRAGRLAFQRTDVARQTTPSRALSLG